MLDDTNVLFSERRPVGDRGALAPLSHLLYSFGMRICIVSGIFEPDIGGPATYAPRLATKLSEAGHTVSVVTLSPESALPTDSAYPFRLVRVKRGTRILNRIRLFFALIPFIRSSDLVYTLDWFAAGLPVAVVSKILRIPYIVRVGGDYLWEKYLEAGNTPVTLREFYSSGLYRSSRYRFFTWLIRKVFDGARRVVFNSDVQRDLYSQYFGISREKSATIFNPVPRIETASFSGGERNKEIVYWGRFVAMKNLDMLVRAFARARLPDYTLTLIGDGPQRKNIESAVRALGIEKRVAILPQMKLRDVLDRVRNCRASALFSWGDISPNQVFEALAVGLPMIVTEETYLSVRDQLPVTVNPHSIDGCVHALEMLGDDTRYSKFADDFNRIKVVRDWDDVVREHMSVFESV